MAEARWWWRMWGHEMHIIPVSDLMVHEERDCVCGPGALERDTDSGKRVTVVVHHSLDGRERSHAS